jgi:uroporphyrinogen decarboxylase
MGAMSTAPDLQRPAPDPAAGANGTALPPDHPWHLNRTSQSPLVRAYRGEPIEGRRPVWFMRQAGRSLPEYRKAREGTAMLESCLTPELASEITLQPVRRHDVDAAILYSDIVVPLKVAGVDVDIAPGVGPVVARPIRTAEDFAAVRRDVPGRQQLRPIADAVRLTVAQLGATPLIGFAGAPFTVASYLVEGRPSRDLLHTKALMHSDPALWDALMGWVADIAGAFLAAQIEAGASAIQLFDSWAGALSLADYTAHVAPYSARVLAAVAPYGVPRVHFGTATGELLGAMRDAGADVVGIDYRIPMDVGIARLGGSVPVQGNIDPALLLAPWPVLEAHVRDVIARGAGAPGHVVNLGHGVPPETDPTVLTRIVELVHSIAPAAS